MATDTNTRRLTGSDALAYAEEHDCTLCKYADPIEDAREGLTLSVAKAVAACDPSLIYLDVDTDEPLGDLAASDVADIVGRGLTSWRDGITVSEVEGSPIVLIAGWARDSRTTPRLVKSNGRLAWITRHEEPAMVRRAGPPDVYWTAERIDLAGTNVRTAITTIGEVEQLINWTRGD